MSIVKIKTSQNIDIDFEIAGIAERIWARIIDLGIFLLLFFFLAALNGMANPFGGGGFNYISIIYVIVAFCYPLIMELFFNGQSFGKMALKIKVMSLDGNQASLGQYLIRWIGRLIDFTISMGAVGLVSTALTDRNQRVGDLLAGTTVVKTKPRTTFEDLGFLNEEQEVYEPKFFEAQLLSADDAYLIQEVLKTYHKTNNYKLITTLEKKLMDKYDIKAIERLSGEMFLEILLTDHHYYAANRG
jgi:uncharacterized RDD family membrane protein YckC